MSIVSSLRFLTSSVALLVVGGAVTVTPPARAQGQSPTLFGVVSARHLDNGMTVVVQEDHRLPIVSLTLRYGFGPSATPAGREGVAVVTTFLMLDRSEHAPPGEAQRLFARAGASRNGDSTGQTGAVLAATVPSNQLALPLWAWSDQMGFFDGAIDDAAVAAQCARLVGLRRAALEGQRLGRVDRFAEEALFPDTHPGHFGTLEPESIEHVDRADVVRFHDAWITPDHATLAIVGDVDTVDALAVVGRYFGTLPRGSRTERSRWEAPPRLDGETLIDVAAAVPQASVSVHWLTPALLTADDAELDVVAHLFKGSRVAWLHWKLVDGAKVATEVRARQRSGVAGSHFEVTLEGAPGKSADELLAALDAALVEARARQPTQAEIGAAVYEELVHRVLATEHPATRAGEYAKLTAVLGKPDYWRGDIARYESVTPRSIHDAIAQWLPADRRVVIRVTPSPGASIGGDRTGTHTSRARTP